MSKLTKNEMNEILSNITHAIYIDSETYYEEFKQVKINNKYIPYLISSFGRLFSLNYRQIKGNIKELKSSFNEKGYKTIVIRYQHEKYNTTIHRLVLSTFEKNPNPKKFTQINHKNGVKTDNYLWNLEWCTPKENVDHAERNGLIKHKTGIDHPSCKVTEDVVNQICKLLATTNKSILEISTITGASKHTIRDIKRGKTWKEIAANYDFTNYNFGHEDITYKVHEICKYAESNLYTMKEISNMTGVSYPVVKNIINGSNYKDISKNYNISIFSNYETNKRKYK